MTTSNNMFIWLHYRAIPWQVIVYIYIVELFTAGARIIYLNELRCWTAQRVGLLTVACLVNWPDHYICCLLTICLLLTVCLLLTICCLLPTYVCCLIAMLPARYVVCQPCYLLTILPACSSCCLLPMLPAH